MKNRSALSVAFAFLFFTSTAQNFSGLQYKRLNKIDDVSSIFESQLGKLFGGRIDGKIDTVVVLYDGENSLKVKIYYTDYPAGYFSVSTMNGSKRQQAEVVPAKLSQALSPSPFECTLTLSPSVSKGTTLESAFLRIDIAKKENGAGRVAIFALGKSWRNQLDPQNVVITASLTPIGMAEKLTATKEDQISPKKATFDPKVIYYQPVNRIRVNQLQRNQFKGGGSSTPQYHYFFSDDISGTWINNDPAVKEISKITVEANKILRAFSSCPPSECEVGTTALEDKGSNNYQAVFRGDPVTTTLEIVLSNGQLTVTKTIKSTFVMRGGNRPVTYIFKKELNRMLIKRFYTLTDPPSNEGTMGGDDGVPDGPEKNSRFLLDNLSLDVDFERPQDICNINMSIFKDRDGKSGVWYFYPADYHLKFEPKTEPAKGFSFHIGYGSSKASETLQPVGDATVRMSATLTAGMSTRERKFVTELLRQSDRYFTRIELLPLREKPDFSFRNTLSSQYNIPQENISVETSTNLDNDIQVSWLTDADTKEFIQAALTSRDGISATVILKPKDPDIEVQQIPAGINLADIRSLGKINLDPDTWRSRTWRNNTPYPLRLNYLHILKKAINSMTPIIYSWAMDGISVAPQAQVAFDNGKVPAWLDTDPSVVMWVDYDIEDCRSCDDKVMNAVTYGVSGTRAQMITFTIPGPAFDSLGAESFMVILRSKQVDPNGEEVKELSKLTITKDGSKEYMTGPLYVPSGGVLEFEYKIKISTKEGDVYESENWIKGTEKDVSLGRSMLKDIFKGIVPGIQ